MAEWLHEYDCRHWIVEENGFQTAIRQDAAIKEFITYWYNCTGTSYRKEQA